MKRSGVRTRTLGLGWEERFLDAVRKARERNLIAFDAAEKLRRLAGAYFCVKCKQEHRTESALGKKHLRLQPAPKDGAPPEPAKEKRGKPAPVKLTEKAPEAGALARTARHKAAGQKAKRRA
ncbi:MAG TPA: hypothetical protein VGR28_10220 [Candidatus Thermoplasmatota archaeon]|nr:hypothetical protein [Candidatus Thermoplasmatota archaeon]